MKDVKEAAVELESLGATVEGLTAVLEAAERLATGADPMLARLLVHARALADEVSSVVGVETERLFAAAA
ncbi:MAG: hypothetical protein HY941_07160 [Gammaproteobacteria bacterium]|nr:hypothetical protein [Gammaproteobacteria bacterium]